MRRFTTIKDSAYELRLFQQRLYISAVVVLILIGLLVYRYADLQIMQFQSFVTQSEKNRVHVQPIAPKRGLIFDRNGILLAENQPSYSLVLIKERVEDLQETLVDLQQLFDLDAKDIEKFQLRLRRRTPYQAVPLKFLLTEDEISRFAVNRYRLPGVEIKAQLVRHYPQGSAFTHALGYVGRINLEDQQRLESTINDRARYAATDHIGKVGLERFYEPQLHGEVGSQHVETNAHGRILRVLQKQDPEPGIDLTLYLDATLQKQIATLMEGRRGSVVVLDPRTGGILAMVSVPSYDANPFVTGISTKAYNGLRESIDLPLFNRSLQGQYPPGSTIKPIMALAGLHYRVISPNSSVADPGWYQLPNDDRLYRDWKRGGHADYVNLHESLAQSCDIYYYDLAYKLGVDRIHEFSKQFGLGSKTGIDSTSERSGLLPSREWKRSQRREQWYPGETLSIGIGQGYMLTTPLQLALATATIANRGIRPVPQLVQPTAELQSKIEIARDTVGPEIIHSSEESQADNTDGLSNHADHSVQFNGEPVAENNWRDVVNGMEAVVHSRTGTARAIGIGAQYKMAGKTGTAQVIGIAQNEEYDAEAIAERKRDHALFVGFAPIDNPSVAIAIVVENGGSGSSTAAPIGRKIFDWVLAGQQQEPLEVAVKP